MTADTHAAKSAKIFDRCLFHTVSLVRNFVRP
nr:MAG TPA: hypothetical protein [Bacteriophage sp.]